ncbi:hypothetical protein DFH11DRAFT_1730683 [Phellopilus nigrolimitatus]|nr:hypothetical protein DFH11DRAFT_1730683 [Phellopilus nigrolimitatus]
MLSRINSNIAEDQERRVRPRLEEYPITESASPSSQSSMADESTFIQTHYKPAKFSSHRALAISEVLLQIFSYFTYTDLGVVSFKRVAPVAVSQVNHQWRIVALSFSRLWASFGFMMSGSYFDGISLRTAEGEIVNLVLVEKWWNRFLDRSRNADLTVIIGSWDTSMSGNTCSLENYLIIRSIIDETVLKHGSRLERLQLCFLFYPPSEHLEKGLCIKDMPRLKWLRYAGSPNLSADIRPESMPNLTELDFTGSNRHPLRLQAIQVPQTRLGTLSIDVTGLHREISRICINFKQLLHRSPYYLRKMSCTFTFTRFPPLSMIGLAREKMRFRALKKAHFKLRSPYPGLTQRILDDYELPGLLCLRCEIDAELPDAWAGIDALLLRSRAPLKTLILTHVSSSPDIAKSPRANDDCILSILRATPHLENVVLRRIDIGDYLRRVLDPADASVRQNLGVLPKLRSADIAPRLDSAEMAQIVLA